MRPQSGVLLTVAGLLLAGQGTAVARAPTSTLDDPSIDYLAKGDDAASRGRLQRARRFWHRAATAGGAMTGAARERLLELNATEVYPRWIRGESPHFVVYAPPGGPVAKTMNEFLSGRERAYERIVNTLGVEPDGPIILYAYSSDRQAWKLLGRRLAFAEPSRRSIHMRHDQQPGHEEAHVIAWFWNRRGSGVPFLEEGLAVALSSHPGSPEAAAAEDLARGVLPTLSDLVTRFHEHRNGYVLAGSFVSLLLEEPGVEAVRQLYVGEPAGFLEHLEEATGQTVEQLQVWWETFLAAREPATREPVFTALSLLRLGRVEEAIELLRRRRLEEPDNPVVEYALAQALRATGDQQGSAAAYRHVLNLDVPYRLAWMQEKARQALQEMDEPLTVNTP